MIGGIFDGLLFLILHITEKQNLSCDLCWIIGGNIKQTASADVLVVAGMVGQETVISKLDAEVFRTEIIFMLVSAEDGFHVTALDTGREQSGVQCVTRNLLQMISCKAESVLMKCHEGMLGRGDVHVHQGRNLMSEVLFHQL